MVGNGWNVSVSFWDEFKLEFWYDEKFEKFIIKQDYVLCCQWCWNDTELWKDLWVIVAMTNLRGSWKHEMIKATSI